MSDCWTDENPWSDGKRLPKTSQQYGLAEAELIPPGAEPTIMLDTRPKAPPASLPELTNIHGDSDASRAEMEQLVNQVISLQELTFGAIQRVEKGRLDHKKMQAENQMLIEYINNLMLLSNRSSKHPDSTAFFEDVAYGQYNDPVADSSIKLESDKAFPVFETPNVIAEQVESIEGPFIIGVAGGGAAGKSQVCGMIMRALVSTTGAIRAHSQVRHIRLEDFYFSLTEEEVRLADAGEYNFDHPDAIDLKLFHKCLQDISTGNPVDIPQYDFQKKQRLAETIRIMPPDVVIVSGILIMYQRKTRDLINLKVFVDVDSDVRLAKQVIRDTEVRHHMTLEQVLDRYAKFVKPSFEEFIFHTKKFADVIIPRGETNRVAVELLTGHIIDILHEREEIR
ncbi:uridine kinase [Batrachochytrium salamandrivorans]|nr:uridine kinase [Batrachochytrium salamandrivorans]